MTDFLTRILNDKKQQVARQKTQRTHSELDKHIQATDRLFDKRSFAHSMLAAYQQKRPAVIAECKKASPSKGVIREDYNPGEIAKGYQAYGATCISVLTDSDFFQGSNAHLLAVRQAVDLPLLRKDFIVDGYQIAESRLIGADCILLILSALDDAQIHDLHQTAQHYDLDVLFETHSITEVERAMALGAQLLGVNNRNLHTFAVNLDTTHAAKQIVSGDTCLITESGIDSKRTVTQMMDDGVYGFLIGEHLMRQPTPGEALKKLFTNL